LINLQAIPVNNYPEVFGEALDSENFNYFLGLILNFVLYANQKYLYSLTYANRKKENDIQFAIDSLQSLSSLRRFSLLVMFISDEEKKSIIQFSLFILLTLKL
jgi:hypothetical protein